MIFNASRFSSITNVLRRFVSSEQSLKELIVEPLTGKDSGILILGLNRVKQKNAISKNLLDSLENAIEKVNNDNTVRVVIIRSYVPRVFCAGADLKERLTMTEADVRIFVNRIRKFMTSLENVKAPVISAIDGAALGGGLEMALATDIRVASENAKIGLVETSLAIIPGAGGTQRLPRIIGVARAKELIFTARILSGREAEEFGIVNYCVPTNEENDGAFIKSLQIARLIQKNGPVGVRMSKLAINKGCDTNLNGGCLVEELCYSQVIPTRDRIEGLKAFQEKRQPIYKGE
ncbi:methylglutaconyl-CoA hydratase, mitochondrial [Rhodnius prolixus]|uniref:methylglutaconyl-CoA hydratase, mitochondrial n=1 Tax=Rhodnius prolixus TaxID=13249 RepID=UPI003D18B802